MSVSICIRQYHLLVQNYLTQGDASSPLLYNIIFNEDEKGFSGTYLFVCADDITEVR
jgi:hypothetical protein